jgi:MurNAc alpha-1-phosphate uridylyltransferase
MTRAILLSAGRGERMRPLSDTIPKPLIPVHNKSLIIHHLEKLAAINIKEVIINISYLGDQIREVLGDGKKFNLKIIYSPEPEALETGGGIVKALPLLGDEPFLVISSDIYTDFPYEKILNYRRNAILAYLILVPNPDYHSEGDFSLGDNGLLTNTPQYTYANIGLYHPDFFRGCTPGRFPLGPLIRQAIDLQQVSGELYKGLWYNAGTMEELKKIQG